MPRNRQIKADFWGDEKVGGLTRDARLMLIGMWNFADDEGLIRWNPLYLRSSIFPYDDIKTDKIKTMQVELNDAKFVMPYKKDNQFYAWIINFKKHQKINRPQESRLPPPRYDYHVYRDIIHARDDYICQKCHKQCDCNNISIDHIVPLVKGGNDYPSNLQVMCQKCNKSKGLKGFHAQFNEHSVNEHEQLNDDSLPNVNVNVNVKENANGRFEIEFNSRWEKYPNKDSRGKSLEHWIASVTTEADLKDFDVALDNYLLLLSTETWRKPKSGKTFFNNWRDFIDWTPHKTVDNWENEP